MFANITIVDLSGHCSCLLASDKMVLLMSGNVATVCACCVFVFV